MPPEAAAAAAATAMVAAAAGAGAAAGAAGVAAAVGRALAVMGVDRRDSSCTAHAGSAPLYNARRTKPHSWVDGLGAAAGVAGVAVTRPAGRPSRL